MEDRDPPNLFGLSLVQALPNTSYVDALALPPAFRATLPVRHYAANPATLALTRPLIRNIAAARQAGDVERFDVARTDFLAAMSTATALDLLEAHDVATAAAKSGLPYVQKLMRSRATVSAGTLLALTWLTSALRPDGKE